MNKDKQKNFAYRISQANKTELVVITYDIILENISEARRALDTTGVGPYRCELKQAQRFLCELMSALDYRYGISHRLLQLYSYVQRILVACDIKGNTKNLDSAENVLRGLRKAFDEISSQDKSGCVMENSQQIFAGLTYGKGTLNETDLNLNGANRGFLA